MFYEKRKDDILFYKHIKEDSFPINGWIHNCYFCEAKSFREEKFKIEGYLASLIICKECKDMNDINLKHDVEDLIYDVYGLY